MHEHPDSQTEILSLDSKLSVRCNATPGFKRSHIRPYLRAALAMKQGVRPESSHRGTDHSLISPYCWSDRSDSPIYVLCSSQATIEPDSMIKLRRIWLDMRWLIDIVIIGTWAWTLTFRRSVVFVENRINVRKHYKEDVLLWMRWMVLFRTFSMSFRTLKLTM